MKEKDNKGYIEFQIAFGAVKHFGRNLYTSNPPAIAELIANSWDAYATECHIISKDNSLILFDNGIGMTDDEFKERYAVSGSEKNLEIRIPDNMKKRPYMGRKGIGKFSAFSLTNEYIVYTKSEEDSQWKKVGLKYNSLMSNEAIVKLPIEYLNDLSELDVFSSDLIKLEHGTIIYIPEMKRRFTEATKKSLKNILSRRFSVNISEKYNFNLFFNNEEINLKEHFYYKEIEFLYYFGYGNEIKEQFKNVEKFKCIDYIEFFKENNIRGWIGSVSKTESLKIEKELNSVGVIVYINGKLADENILSSIQNSTISNLYIVGEVEADFLQNESEDPVLSSREGLNKENENVVKLMEELDNIRNGLTKEWNNLRASRSEDKQDYLKKILENKDFKQLYDRLRKEEKDNFKKYCQKLFDANKNDISHQLLKYYVPCLISIVNTETLSKITIEDKDEISEVIDKFYTLFNKTEINTAIRIHENIKERLEVIEKLKQDIDEEAIEKVFENNLANNPWLINPYWDVEKRVRITTQDRYKILIDNNKIEGISDIIVQVHEEKLPIIVELKREKKTSYSAPDCGKIIDQIRKYRNGIKEILKTKGEYFERDNIKAFFLLGVEARKKIDQDDLKELEKSNIKIITYDEIIDNAYNLYHYDLL